MLSNLQIFSGGVYPQIASSRTIYFFFSFPIVFGTNLIHFFRYGKKDGFLKFHSHTISKSDSSGGEPVVCDSAQHTTWVAQPPSTPTTKNTPTRCQQQTTQYLSTGIKRQNLKKNNLVKKLEHIKLITGGWVGATRFTHLDCREWSETTCTLAYTRCHVSSAWQPVS